MRLKRACWLAAIGYVLLTSCSPLDPNERFIQGGWNAAGDQGEGHSWYLEWTFSNGTFEVTGYPPLHQTGKYRLTASEGSALTLELYDQAGDWPADDRAITILVDQAGDALTIDGQGPFSRVEP